MPLDYASPQTGQPLQQPARWRWRAKLFTAVLCLHMAAEIAVDKDALPHPDWLDPIMSLAFPIPVALESLSLRLAGVWWGLHRDAYLFAFVVASLPIALTAVLAVEAFRWLARRRHAQSVTGQ
jgi:hypothetical protein